MSHGFCRCFVLPNASRCFSPGPGLLKSKDAKVGLHELQILAAASADAALATQGLETKAVASGFLSTSTRGHTKELRS